MSKSRPSYGGDHLDGGGRNLSVAEQEEFPRRAPPVTADGAMKEQKEIGDG